VAPKKYWELYEREKLSLATNPYIPVNSPIMAIDGIYELRACYDLEWVMSPHESKLPEATARLLKHGYYASVSYIDACLGELLSALDDLGLQKNTIVVVLGDHGWKLGEHGSWCKQTNYNIDTRVPLIIRAPQAACKGLMLNHLIELVDLFPTLCELAGIKIPSNLEGSSFVPLLDNPTREGKMAVFSQYHRSPYVSPDGKRYMGYTMVTQRYHYVEWRYWDNEKKSAGDLAAIELYDNQRDSEENTNIANLPGNASLIAELAKQLKAGWRAASPS
jgi:iduronate 2-sulfatase